MSNPTGDALVARIKSLEHTLKTIQVSIEMDKNYNYQTILMLIKQVLK